MNTVLFQAPDDRRLSLVVAFEDGRVAHLVYTGTKAFEPVWREEGEDWELVWDRKGHREAGANLSLSLSHPQVLKGGLPTDKSH